MEIPTVKRLCIPRDTGAAQSFLLTDVLPLSEASFTGSYSIAQGIDMSFIKVPLHHIFIDLKLVAGCFKVAVRTYCTCIVSSGY